MDNIEGIKIDVDAVDGDYGVPRIVATLIIEGDFVEACERYLANTDEKSYDYCKMFLRIDRGLAEDLYNELERTLFQ